MAINDCLIPVMLSEIHLQTHFHKIPGTSISCPYSPHVVCYRPEIGMNIEGQNFGRVDDGPESQDIRSRMAQMTNLGVILWLDSVSIY